jgi:ABC-type bacteriocin/lantibiotic exporter with double-glycine peptidase domain
MKFAFADLLEFTRIYRKQVGNKWLLFVFSAIIPAVLDGIGISMIIPFLNLVMGPTVENSATVKDGDFAYQLLSSLGISITLKSVLLFICAIYFLKFLLSFCNNAFRSIMYANLVKTTRETLYDRIMNLDYSAFKERNTGYYTNIVGVQVNQFLNGFTILTQFYTKIFTSASYLAFSLFIDWKFSLLAGVSGLLIIGSFRSFNSTIKSLSKETSSQEAIQTNFFIQGIQAFKYLCATAGFGIFKGKLNQSIEKIRRQRLKSELIRSLYEASYEPLTVFLICFLVWAQVTLMDKPLASMLLSIFLFYRAMSNILITQKDWQMLLNVSGGIGAVYNEFESAAKLREESGVTVVDTLRNGIRFENVSFSYSQNGVLRDFNLIIPQHSMIALVGESGAGKTTVTDLITFVLKPGSGRIFVDRIAMPDVSLSSLRRKIGFITQDVQLFDDTIANNISLWQADYGTKDGQRRIEEAAKLAHCDEFIRNNPLAYQERIGDRGLKLSGGQRQRIAIARELFKRPEILIMDEATSALDSESENFIKKTLKDLKGKVTIVLVAHRLSTVKEADNIIVMRNGRVDDQGSFEELMSRQGYFSELVELQKL